MKWIVIRVTEAQYAQMSATCKKEFEVVNTVIENEKKDELSIKVIRKSMKKILHSPTVSDIVSFTGYGRPKVIRILNQYDGVYWESEQSFGKVGKPTKVYKRIKNKKDMK